MNEEKNKPKKPFSSLFEEVSHSHCCSGHHPHRNGHHFPGMPHDDDDNHDHSEHSDEADENQTLTDEMDHEILMHRDSHFGGDFQVMLEYYQSDFPGVNPDFDLERIEYLAQVENELGQNLAPMILTGVEAERVARAKEAYRKLKSLYEIESPKNDIPRLIADLILTEKEDPQEELGAIVAKGSVIVPELIHLLQSEDSFDPLFPGYGLSPFLAIICLGLLKDTRAIIPLFETLGKDMVFEEEVILDAFKEIGTPAKEFLIKLVTSRPLTSDNSNAAYGLLAFIEDEDVAELSLHQLKDKVVHKDFLLSSFLLCNCLSLKDTASKQEFIQLAQDHTIHEDLREQMNTIIQEWK